MILSVAQAAWKVEVAVKVIVSVVVTVMVADTVEVVVVVVDVESVVVVRSVAGPRNHGQSPHIEEARIFVYLESMCWSPLW